jgi:hypothetical protein
MLAHRTRAFLARGVVIQGEDGQPARIRMTIVGGFAYFNEETSDGLIVIRKCRLVGL